jgi:hypothetical protein
LILLLLLLGWSFGLSAEVIHLKNGQVLVGRVIGQTRESMRIQTERGVRTIAKNEIRRVSYSQAEEDAIRQKEAAAEERRRKAEEAEQQRREEAARRKAEAEAARKAEQQAADAADTTETPPPGTTTPRSLVMRQALVPGLGHIGMGKTITGATYMGLAGLTLFNFVSSRRQALSAEAQNSQDVLVNLALTFAPNGIETAQRLGINIYLNQIAQEPYRNAIARYDQSLLLLVAVYSVQMIHIIYDVYFSPSDAVTTARPARDPYPGWDFGVAFAPATEGHREPDLSGQVRYTLPF